MEQTRAKQHFYTEGLIHIVAVDLAIDAIKLHRCTFENHTIILFNVCVYTDGCKLPTVP